MLAFVHDLLSRLRALFGFRSLEKDFDDELDEHLAMAEEHLIRQGISPTSARRRARVDLGGLSQLREAGRETRGLPGLATCLLDVKLGARMLVRYWGLSLVGGLSISAAFVIAGLFFGVMNLFVDPTLPFEDGDRIVVLETWNTQTRATETRYADFEQWRDGLDSVHEVGAFRNALYTLSVDGGPTETVSVAEMSASGFAVTRVPPFLGGVFTEEAEFSGGDPVVVIGYDAWRRQFESDPGVVGQAVRLDGTPHTVIGVMPADFAFPVNHRYWVPLGPPPGDAGGRGRIWTGIEGGLEAGVVAFGRLVDGATTESAHAEVEALGLAPSGDGPDDDPRWRARVLPYTHAFNEPGGRLVRLIQFLVSLILLPPCANIAILVYARTLARQEEFSARFALGASRGRIVLQLFIEAFVLTGAATAVAIGLVAVAFRYARSLIGSSRPFWMYSSLSWTDVALYLGGLAVAAAVIVGFLPAIRSTGPLLREGLDALGSRSRLRLGTTWTVLVVLQMAVAIAILPSAIDGVWYIRSETEIPGFADEVLTARLRMDQEANDANEPEGEGLRARFGRAGTELIRRLDAATNVRASTITPAPGGGGSSAMVEFEPARASSGIDPATEEATELNPLLRVGMSPVDEGFFNVFDRRLLSGRLFEAGDFTSDPDVVVISRPLAERIGGDVLGRRLRRASDPSTQYGAPSRTDLPDPARWYAIVGVVDEDDPGDLHVYHPTVPGRVHPVYLALDLGPDPAASAAGIREITESVDPALEVDQFITLGSLMRRSNAAQYYIAGSLGAMASIMIFLSAAGIHALMSVILSQRRREIGVRVALGATPSRLLPDIFGHAALRLAAGAAGGILLALLLRSVAAEELAEARLPGVIPSAAAAMIAVGLVAALGPVRRALRVDPNATLRNE